MTDTARDTGPDDLVIARRRSTVDEFRALAESVDWLDHYHWPSMPRSLDATVHGVVAIRGGFVIGMARMFGDGVCYLTIHDVIVHPEHQGGGVAELLIEHLLDISARGAAAPIWVGLFASPEAEGVYEQAGFGSTEMRGMWREVAPA